LRALARLRQAGIDVGINVMPVLPGITDDPRDIDALVRAVAAAGATHLNAGSLRLRSTARARYLPFISEHFPHLADRYARSYANGHALSDQYREGLQRHFRKVCAREGVHYGSPDDDGESVYLPKSRIEPQTDLFCDNSQPSAPEIVDDAS
jgi:DNA repair photolyase